MLKRMQGLLPLFEKALYWGLFIVLIFIPLYMKFPLIGVTGTFVSIRLDDVLLALVIFIWIIKVVISGEFKKLLSDKLNQALLLFFFIGLVSLFSAHFLTHTVDIKLGLLHFLRRVQLLIFLPLAVSVVKDVKIGRKLLLTSAIVLVIVNLYGLGQLYLRFPVVSTTTSELSKGAVYYLTSGDRISSTFAGHYDLAVYLMMAVIIIIPITIYLVGNRTKSFFESGRVRYALLLSFLGMLSLMVLVMTAARLSFVAAIFGILLALIIVGRKRIIFAALAISILILLYPSQLRDRLISTFTINIQRSWSGFEAKDSSQAERSLLNIPTLPNSSSRTPPEEHSGLEVAPDITPGEPTNPVDIGVFRSFEIRIRVEWPRAIRAFIKNPLLGTGYSSIGLATDNDILRSLGEVGLLGTIAFALVLTEIAKRLWGGVRKTGGFIKYLSVGVFSMFIAFIINSLFIDVFEASKIALLLWIVLGINLALTGLDKNEKKTI